MRNLDVKCDNCGAAKPPRHSTTPATTWWVIEDLGFPPRTGPLDFCSLPCMHHFINHDDIRQIFAADFTMPAGEPGKVNVPLRYRVVRYCQRIRVWRWVLQLLIVRTS